MTNLADDSHKISSLFSQKNEDADTNLGFAAVVIGTLKTLSPTQK